MRTALTVTAIVSTALSAPAMADEFCDKEIGLKDYSLEAEDGALAAANGSLFRLI